SRQQFRKAGLLPFYIYQKLWRFFIVKDISKKVLAVIDDHEKNGDVYHDRTDIIARVQGSYPEITEDEINMTLIHLSQDGYLIRIDDDYCVTETHYAEDQAARQIAEIIRHNE